MSQAGDISAISGPISPVIPTSFLLDDGNSAVPAANVLIVHGGVGSSTAIGVSNEIVINVATTGFDWSEETTNFLAVSGHGYFCNASLNVTLPANVALAIGSTVIIYVDTSSAVTVTANTGEFIQVGTTISVSGGTAVSSTRGSILELVFKPSDATWHTISSMGVWSVT